MKTGFVTKHDRSIGATAVCVTDWSQAARPIAYVIAK